jgi:hypothetical protein
MKELKEKINFLDLSIIIAIIVSIVFYYLQDSNKNLIFLYFSTVILIILLIMYVNDEKFLLFQELFDNLIDGPKMKGIKAMKKLNLKDCEKTSTTVEFFENNYEYFCKLISKLNNLEEEARLNKKIIELLDINIDEKEILIKENLLKKLINEIDNIKKSIITEYKLFLNNLPIFSDIEKNKINKELLILLAQKNGAITDKICRITKYDFLYEIIPIIRKIDSLFNKYIKKEYLTENDKVFLILLQNNLDSVLEESKDIVKTILIK